MTRRWPTIALALGVAVATAHPGTAPAWEPATTHAGLTEQAALTSVLHQRLQQQFVLRQ